MNADSRNYTTVEVPATYTERVPEGALYAKVDVPAVTLKKDDKLEILKQAYTAFGEPEAIRCFIDGNQVAFLPASADHPHSYKVFGVDNRAKIAAGWLKHELEIGKQPTPGCYELDREEDLWVVDFSQGPIERDSAAERGAE
jgi:hypothetical protein